MLILFYLILLLINISLSLIPFESNSFKLDKSKTFKRKIKFENSYPTKPRETRCSYLETNRFQEEYISKIISFNFLIIFSLYSFLIFSKNNSKR